MLIKGFLPTFFRNADAGGVGGVSPPPPAPWFDSFDAETKGYIQTRGWDKKTPQEAFLEVSKAHKEAEKYIGAPADKLLRIPDERPTDTAETKARHAEEWKAIYQRLGAPKDPKEYDFKEVKHQDGTALEEAFIDHMRAAFAPYNVTKDGAAAITKAVVDFNEKKAAAEVALKNDTLATEKAALKKNWGTNEAANMVTAQGAIRALGVTPEEVAALEKVTGYAKVMELFRNIGTKIGEDRFVSIENGGGGRGPMTVEQAKAELADLKRDKAWVKRYTDGGVEEGRKMLALNRIISSVPG